MSTIKKCQLLVARLMPTPASASPLARKRFDYGSLDIETSQFVQQQTGEIRLLFKRTAQGIVEIGHKLIEIKEKLGHGRFLDWLETEFDGTKRTAQQFMNVARYFKGENISDLLLAPSALYILAAPSTPEAARTEALARASAGESITRTTAKAIKQKYATPQKTPRAEPQLQPVSQPQPIFTLAPSPQAGSKLEIVAIRPQSTAPTLTTQFVVGEYEPKQSNIWWQLGGRHLLYCGNPNSPEFSARVRSQEASLLFAFPPSPDWQPAFRCRTHLITMEYLPQRKELRLFEDALETLVLLYSGLNDLVVSCFLPEPEILSIINRLDRRGLLADPDSRRCNEIISDWKKVGLKVERLS